MGEKYLKIKKEIESNELAYVICDMKECGKIIDTTDSDHEQYQSVFFSWGYNSGQEDQTWYGTICETCVKKQLSPLINFHVVSSRGGLLGGEEVWQIEEHILQEYSQAFNIPIDDLRHLLPEFNKLEDPFTRPGSIASALENWEQGIVECEDLLKMGTKPKHLDIWNHSSAQSLLDLPAPIGQIARERFKALDERWKVILLAI